MTKNYAALGEHYAHKQQAKDAANRRFAILHNLAMQAARLSENPQTPMDAASLRASLDDAEAAEREMHAALFRANQAAALCGEASIRPETLAP